MSEFVMGARLELTDNFSGQMSTATRATEQFIRTADTVNQTVTSFSSAMGGTVQPSQAFADNLQGVSTAADAANQDTAAFSSTVGNAEQATQTFTDTLQEAATAAENIETPITQASNSASGFLGGVRRLTGGVKDFAKTKITSITDKFTQFKTRVTGGETGVKGLWNATKTLAKTSLSALHTGITKVGNLAIAAGKRVTQSLGGAFKSIGKGLGNLSMGALKGIGVGVAGLGVAAGAASAGIFKLATMASDLDETLNKVDVAFGESSTEVKAWSENSIKSMGLSKQTALDMTSLFGDMGTSMGIPQKEAAAMSMGMTQLGADLASFKNIGIDEATTALNGVFTGETESLKRLGIVMTQTNLEQFALSQGMTKNIKDMTEAEKVNLRYAYVMSKTTNAQGDFVRTGGGFANQLRQFKELFKDIGTNIGTLFVPSLTKGLQSLNAFGVELNDIFKDGWQEGDDQKMADVFSRMIDKGVSALSSGLPKVINTVVPIINTLAGSILKALPTVLPALVNGVTTIFKSLIGLIQQNKQPLIDLAVNVVTSLVDFLITAIPDIVSIGADLIVGFAQGLAKQLPTIIPQIADSAVKAVTSFLSCAIDLLPGVLLAGMDLIVKFAQGLAKQLPIIVPQAVKAIETLVTGLMANLDALIVAGLDIINGLILGIIQNLPLILSAAMKLIQSVVTGLLNNIQLIINCALNLVNALVMGLIQNIPMLLQGALQLVMGIVNGLVSNIQLIIDGALTLVNALVLGIVQNLPTIIQAAVQVVIALAIGLIQAIPQLIAAVPQLVMGIIDTILSTNWLEVGWEIVKGIGKGLWDGIKGIFGGAGEAGGKEMANGAAQGAESGLAAITDASAQTASSFTTGLQPDYSAISGYGVEAGTSLSTGLTTGAASVGTNATQVGTDAMLGLSSGFTTALPDTLATVSNVGLESVTGLSTGMTDNLGLATTAATSVTTGVTDTFNGIDLHGAGTNAMQGFIDGMNAMRSSIMDVANGIANSVKTTINSALDIRSPSRVLEESGEFAGEGLVLGIMKMVDRVKAAAQGLSDSTVEPFATHSTTAGAISPSGVTQAQPGKREGLKIAIENIVLQNVGDKDPKELVAEILKLLYTELSGADEVLSAGEMGALLI